MYTDKGRGPCYQTGYEFIINRVLAMPDNHQLNIIFIHIFTVAFRQVFLLHIVKVINSIDLALDCAEYC